jgi:glycerol-3-phosphate dehydrogenase
LLPWKGKLLAGTGHAPWLKEPVENPMPSSRQIEEFCEDLSAAIPSLKLREGDVEHVFAGLLPVTETGSNALAVREVIIDHAMHGGPPGFYSVSGVKFTTARLVAENVLKACFPAGSRASKSGRGKERPWPLSSIGKRGIFSSDSDPVNKRQIWREALASIVDEESVVHLDDLVFRRTSLWECGANVIESAPKLCELFDWHDLRCQEEIGRLGRAFKTSFLI